jgi:hypothetical protein
LNTDSISSGSEAETLPPDGIGGSARLQTLREIATNSIRYWEPRRLLYNAVLALIVLWYFFAGWPESKSALSLDLVLLFVVLAVLANVAYCGAYVADVFVQFSGLRSLWFRIRWVLLTVGIVLAAIITRFWALGLFSAGSLQ